MADEIHYLLRRAERESVEAIRAADPKASARHAELAALYSARVHALLAAPGGGQRAA